MSLILIGVFAGVLALILGAYAVFVVRPERTLLARLQPAATLVHSGVIKQDAGAVVPAQFQPFRAPMRVWTAPLGRLLMQAGLKMTVGAFLLLTLIASVTFAAVVGVLTGVWWMALSAGIAVAFVPWLIIRRIRNGRLAMFEEQFPDAVDLVARALRAGHALTTGLGMVADEFKGPIGAEFRILYDEQNFGLTIQTAMRNFAERVPLLDARFFVTAVLTQREAGGNLAEVLDNLATVIRDRFRVKRQIHVISTHGRMTGWVLVLLPPTLAVLFMVISANHIQLLWTDPLGFRMIIAAIILQLVGTLVIRRIINVEY